MFRTDAEKVRETAGEARGTRRTYGALTDEGGSVTPLFIRRERIGLSARPSKRGPHLMRPTIAGLMIFVLTFWVAHASAEDLQTSFTGIAWGAAAEDTRNLTLTREDGDERYYTRPDEFYPLGGVTCEDIRYGYYQNQFFAVFMTVKNQADFREVREHLNERYGDARSQMRMDRTIYIWDFLDIKIKLKHYEEREAAKLAYYYTPLSTKVNEARKATKSETVIKIDAGEEEELLDF